MGVNLLFNHLDNIPTSSLQGLQERKCLEATALYHPRLGRLHRCFRLPEHHFLILKDDILRIINLNAAVYSVGRGLSNKISLKNEAVSRHHATLLRLPGIHERYYKYRMIDGSNEGIPSKNGVRINDYICKQKDLVHGDLIIFGWQVQGLYLKMLGELNYIEELFQGISFEKFSFSQQHIDLLLNFIKSNQQF